MNSPCQRRTEPAATGPARATISRTAFPGCRRSRRPRRASRAALLHEQLLAGLDQLGFRLGALEVLDRDHAALDADERAVAAVVGEPLRAADRRGAVAAAGAE